MSLWSLCDRNQSGPDCMGFALIPYNLEVDHGCYQR